MSYTNTVTFIDVYPDKATFKSSFRASSFTSFIPAEESGKPDYLGMLYDLLVCKYCNSKVSTTEVEPEESGEPVFPLTRGRFNSVIFQFGPKWIKDLEIQQKLIGLSEDELTMGSTQKSQHGYNPSTDISGNTDTSISTVNEQSLVKYTKNKVQGYATLVELLRTDVTQSFINKFRQLFMVTVDYED